MAYRMLELTDYVRAGRTSNHSLNIEVWDTPRGWELSAPSGQMEEITIPHEAVVKLLNYFR